MENTNIRTENWQEFASRKEKEIMELKAENAELNKKIEWLMEQFRLGQQRRFGSSSEKYQSPEQLNLFNEVEATAEESIAEPELIEIERHYRKRRRSVNERLPEELPIEKIEYELPQSEQICPECGEGLHVMGKETRRELKFIPAKAVIVEHIRKIYSCRDCEKKSDHVPIVKAKMPEPVIKGSFASPEAIAHIMTQKFVMCAPLYRQEAEWKRNAILLSRQTMSNWLMKATESWLEPIYHELQKRLLAREVLHADETVLQVLHEDGKTAQSKSYMWLYRTSGDAENPIVLYEYQPDRRAERPETFLKEFKGYLHADGYSGYHDLPETIKIVGCFAHARRKWVEALKAIPSKARDGTNVQKGVAYIDKLFALERKFAEISPAERFKKRQELAKPVLDEFLAWIKSITAPPKTLIGVAAHYTLSQWKYLERYLLDGRLEISNNRAERSIKPFVIARKNFLFSNTPNGAKTSAIMFSIIETAKENGLNPFEYLTYIFKNAPNWNIRNDPEALLRLIPGSDQIPGFVRYPSSQQPLCHEWEEIG